MLPEMTCKWEHIHFWAPNLGCRGAESPGWFDVSPKNCMRYDVWTGSLLWWSCQSPVAHSCSLLNHLNSFHGGMFTFNAKFDSDSLLYLFSQFEWEGHKVHILIQWCLPPHCLVQWSVIVHACVFPSTLLGCQITLMYRKSFSLY